MENLVVKEEKKQRRIGKKVNLEPKPMTIDEVFFADVEKIPAKEVMPNFVFESYNSYLIKIKQRLGDVIVNNCSENYLLIPNKEIFPAIEDGFKQFHKKVEIKREIKNNSQFYTEYRFDSKEDRHIIKENDILIPKIIIQNSYNGKLNYGIRGGFYRFICENGLTMPVSDFSFNISISHCENNLKKIVASTIENVNSFLNNSKQIFKKFEELCQSKVGESDLEDLVENILSSTNYLLSKKNDIISRIKEENVTEGVEYNLWNVYNGINYYLQPTHNSYLTAAADVRDKMDTKILDFIYENLVA